MTAINVTCKYCGDSIEDGGFFFMSANCCTKKECTDAFLKEALGERKEISFEVKFDHSEEVFKTWTGGLEPQDQLAKDELASINVGDILNVQSDNKAYKIKITKKDSECLYFEVI